MRRSWMVRLSPLLCLLLFTPCPDAPARTRDARGDITVADYCAMTQSLLEISVSEWQERVEVAARKKGDRKAMLRELDVVAKSYRDRHEEVYRQHGMNAREDLRYASDHRSEIENYLEENPEVRDSIESLRGRINVLIEQFEPAAANPTEGALR